MFIFYFILVVLSWPLIGITLITICSRMIKDPMNMEDLKAGAGLGWLMILIYPLILAEHYELSDKILDILNGKTKGE